MSRSDRDPVTWTRGEVWDAYQLAVRQGENIYRENIRLAQRQAKLEDALRALLERAADGAHGSLFCTCEPTWDAEQGVWIHGAGCALTTAQALLRETIRPRLDYGRGGGGEGA